MNWEAIGAIGEILGGSAVLITLLYLALQIKQNTAALRQAGREHNYDAAARLSNQLVRDKDLVMLWRVGRMSLEKLDQDDRLRWRAMANTRLVYWQIVYKRSQELGDRFMVRVALQAVTQLLTYRSIGDYWEATEHQFRPEFVREVRKWQRENPAPSRHSEEIVQ